MRPLFVTVVGIDGSGKTTQAKRLIANLAERGHDAEYVWARWEPCLLRPAVNLLGALSRSARSDRPSEAEASENVHRARSAAKKKVLGLPGLKSLWLRAALLDYYLQIRRRLIPRLRSHDVVVCDRYLYDAFVDLAANFRSRPERVPELMKNRIAQLFPKPDLGIFIDIPPEVGYRRKADGTALGYLRERQALYSAVASAAGMELIDGNRDPDEVQAALLSKVLPRVEGR